MVTTSTGIYNQQTAGTEEGCYTVLQNSTGAYNLFYIDYATKQMVYLSSNPSSMHNTEEDTSFLGESPGGASLFAAGEHLYWMILGGTFGGERVSVPAQIIQMDLDGSNKKVVYSLNNGEFLGNTAFAYDGSNFYFWVSAITAEKNLLVSVSAKTGKSNVLAEFGGDTQCQLLGTSEDKLILRILAPKSPEPYVLVSISIKDGAQKELIRWKEGERTFAVCQGDCYSFSPSDGMLYKLSMPAGEETACFKAPIPLENGEQYRLLTDTYDGHLFFLQQNTNDLFVVECDTGAARKIVLQKDGFNASIVAETKDSFLVFPEYKIFTFAGTAVDGTPEEQQLILPQYALMSKNNYWNSVPEYAYISYENFMV